MLVDSERTETWTDLCHTWVTLNSQTYSPLRIYPGMKGLFPWSAYLIHLERWIFWYFKKNSTNPDWIRLRFQDELLLELWVILKNSVDLFQGCKLLKQELRNRIKRTRKEKEEYELKEKEKEGWGEKEQRGQEVVNYLKSPQKLHLLPGDCSNACECVLRV